ncbi:MAG: hypothetical protein FJ387_27775, partial [Verrucomicrobia bacterium]|nr:hypothetical protein [Verrucomicrobiota bacterium]
VWTPRASPTSKTLWGVAYGNNRFVACGDDGTLLTSANGVAWESMPSGVTPNCVDAAYGNGIYVVVGSQGVILTSPDGRAPWTRQTVNTTGWFMDVSFNAGWFVAGANDGTVAVSQNGRDWTVKNLGADYYLPATGYGFGRWLVGGRRGTSDAALFASTDATQWEPVVTGQQTMFAGMALGEGRLVMVGGAEGAGGTGTVLVTVDGSSWQKADFGQVQSLFDVAHGNGMWVAVGQAGAVVKGLSLPVIVEPPRPLEVSLGAQATFTVAAEGAPVLTYQWRKGGAAIPGASEASLALSNVQPSDAGDYSVVVSNPVGSVTSDPVTLTVLIPNYSLAVAAVGQGTADVAPSLAQYPLGSIVQLTARPAAGWRLARWEGDLGGSVPTANLTMDGDKRVTAYFESLPVMAAGFEWKQINAGTDAWLWNVAHGADRFVAVGDRGTVLTSVDGEVWTAPSTPTANRLWGLTYGNSRFVATGAEGTLLTSLDGREWQRVDSGVVENLADAAYGNNTFVVVGGPGVVLTSPDGNAPWTRQTVNTTGWLMDVSFNAGWFLSGLNDGSVAFSANGRDWTVRHLEPSYYLPATGYGFGKWIVGGRAGTVDGILLASGDLTQWQLVRTVASTMFAGIAAGQGRLVAVAGGEAGWGTSAIQVSTDGADWQSAGLAGLPSLYDVAYANGTWLAVGQSGAIVKGLAAPWIIAQPQGGTADVGATMRFSVAAEGAPVLTYQWSRNGSAIEGATGSSLTLASVQPADAGSYTVTVTNPVGSVISRPVELVVTGTGLPPSFALQPQGGTFAVGARVTLEAIAIGTAPLRFQWSKDGANIAGATAANLTLDPVGSDDAGSYTVSVSNAAGSVASGPAVVVIEQVAGAPQITQQPQSQWAAEGAVVTLQVSATGNPTLTYQWRRNGVIIQDATAATLTIPSFNASVQGTFTVSVCNNQGCVSSAPALLALSQAGGTVNFNNRVLTAGIDAPVLDSDGMTRLAGPRFLAQLYAGPAPDRVEAVGPAVPFRDAGGAGYWSTAPNGLRNVRSVQPGEVAFVQVRAWEAGLATTFEGTRAAGGKAGVSELFSVRTGGAGDPPSLPADLVGLTSFSLVALPVIVTPADDQLVMVGEDVVFEVTVRGSGLRYQWRFNGVDIPGATDATLRLGTVLPDMAGSYDVVICNAVGCVMQPPVVLYVYEAGGQVNFNNRVLTAGIDAPVFTEDGTTRLAGDQFLAQLYAGPTAQSLMPVGPAVIFRDGAGAGYWSVSPWPVRNVPSVLPGGVAFFQVRVWETGYGITFEDAWAAGARAGMSEVISVMTGGAGEPPSFPADMVGLQSFTLFSAPVILVGPQSLDLHVGQEAIFEVVASGGFLDYQWRLNGVPIPGAVGPRLRLPAVEPRMAGTYSVVVCNPRGCVTSGPAVLNVNQPGGTVNFNNRVLVAAIDAPVFDEDGTTRLEGDDYLAQLYAGPSSSDLEAVGPAVPFRTGNAAGYWVVTPSAVRSIPTVEPGAVAYVQARVWELGKGITFEDAVAAGSKVGLSDVLALVTGGAGEPPSFPADLAGLRSFQLTRVVPPTILSHPLSRVALVGSSVSLQVVATSPTPMTYQWQRETAPGTWQDLPGATAHTLWLQSVQLIDSGQYRAIVRNAGAAVVSRAAWVRVLAPPRFAKGGLARNPTTGRWSLSLEVTPGFEYEVEFSTDLQRWTPLVRVMGGAGRVQIDDPDPAAAQDRYRFYRVRVLEL